MSSKSKTNYNTHDKKIKENEEGSVMNKFHVEWVSPNYINPFNPVRSHSRLNELISSMEQYGWKGNPIITLGGEQAITGSHRLQAAKEAGLEKIPVVNLDADFLTADQWSELEYAKDTESLLRTFEEFSDDGTSGLDEVIDLLEQEVSNEQLNWRDED